MSNKTEPIAQPHGGALRSFKPGQSGNPGGKTSAQRKLEVENAEKATRIHGALLDQVITLIESGMAVELEANILKLVKDAQDRGLGTATQRTEHTGDMTINRTIKLISE